MSQFRRRLLMQNALKGSSGGDLGYIKDGLILHLDGIEKGSDSTAWTDLVGGKKFIYTDCKLNSDSVEFNGVSSKALRYGDLKLDVYTVEICIKGYKDFNQPQMVLYPSSYDGLFIGFQQASIDIQSINLYEKTFKILSNIGSYSVGQKAAFQNKKKLSNTSTPGWGHDNNGYYCIGMRLSDGPNRGLQYKGKIYSIRMYSRVLSEQEMLQNQQVDIDRFFGGVTPQ